MSIRALCRIVLGLTVTFGACRVRPTTAPAPADTGGFIVTLGRDTLSAESWALSGNKVEGTFTRRVPRAVVVRYTMFLAPTGLATRLEYATRLPDGGMLPNGARQVVATFTGDSVLTEITRDTIARVRVAARRAFPELDGALYFYSLPVTALQSMKVDSADFVSYPPGAREGEVTPVASRGKGSNRYWLYSGGSPIEVGTDASGRIESVDGSRTTLRIQARRLPTVDVAAIAQSFAQRERASGAMAALSPRDSVIAALDGVRLSIDYGRPSARGRRIFGSNGVLGDTLWRTGANASTKFTVSAPIQVGGQTLAAGTYVLSTLAIPGRYHLIFSADNREQLRVPLTAAPIDPLVERFTITVDGTGSGSGILRMRWDTLELSVPLAASR